jgi:hypothetical protein
MQIRRVVALGVIVVLGACGGAGSGGETAAAPRVAEQGPHAHAVTKQFSVDMDGLKVEEKTYVDGVALRTKDAAGALLTEVPLSACTKLAIVARGDLEFDSGTLGEKPALKLVRDEEHPKGAILLIEPYSTTTLEGDFPALVTDGGTLSASGDIGDAGWGSIDATKYGKEKAPHVRLDVKLPYATLDGADPIAADASAEAKWLRETQAKAGADTQAAAEASMQAREDDYSTSSAWFDILGNWSDLSVIALASDKGCATMVLRAPGFAGGYREAVIQTRLEGDARKVTSAKTESFDSVEGDYVVGRIEYAKLGAFPVVHARAAREEGVGLVVYFSDKPIAAEPFESLVAKQRMLRAVSSFESGSNYSFSHYDLGGPGVPVEQIDAGNSTSNPYVDEKDIAGLIKLENADGPRIAVNFHLGLKGTAK